MTARPIYHRIASSLRSAIHTGEYPAGSRLPTEHELCERFAVSRNTVRLALAHLAAEGLIESAPGRGTYVRRYVTLTHYATRTDDLKLRTGSESSYVTEVQEQGRVPRQDFEMSIRPATGDIAAKLWIEEGDPVVLRRCIRFVDDVPSSIQDSYYPMDLAREVEELLSPTPIRRGTVRSLAERGYTEAGYVNDIWTRMPEPWEAETLELVTGTPVLVHRRTGYTTQRPIRITVTVYAGDRNRVVYELGELKAFQEQIK